MGYPVIIRRCAEYRRDLVFNMIHELIETMGGMKQFVRRGQTVCIKPNMLSAKDPGMGVTTHPLVVEAVVKEVQSEGGKALIGDSPSGVHKGLEVHWEKTGLKAVAERTGAQLVNFEASGTLPRVCEGRTYYISRVVLEADVVINLPKLKTHGMTLYTGAIKNLYGTLPGYQKTTLHKQFVNPTRFSQVLVDIYSQVPVALHLMDGITGMAGNGPSTGEKRHPGLLMASVDAVALDAVSAYIMGFKEHDVDMIRIAGQRGKGEWRIKEIEVKGEVPESCVQKDFPLPSNHMMKYVPQFLADMFGGFVWVKPVADYALCTGCGICASSCPVNAIEIRDDRPVMDYKICINCLCCNESCPEGAIKQKRSWLAKQIS